MSELCSVKVHYYSKELIRRCKYIDLWSRLETAECMRLLPNDWAFGALLSLKQKTQCVCASMGVNACDFMGAWLPTPGHLLQNIRVQCISSDTPMWIVARQDYNPELKKASAQWNSVSRGQASLTGIYCIHILCSYKCIFALLYLWGNFIKAHLHDHKILRTGSNWMYFRNAIIEIKKLWFTCFRVCAHVRSDIKIFIN